MELAGEHQIVADFVKKRGAHPLGSEPIQSLLPRLVAYSLHSGRYRGATWYQERAAIVWLLAARWHEQGSAEDAYPYFERLLREGRIWPTREDVEHVVASRRLTFERALLEQVPTIRQAAIEHPGQVEEAVIGGRVQVRIAYENGDSALLYVAIAQRLLPGEIPLPAEWQVQVLAAFFLGVPLAEVELIGEIAGHALHADEVGYCALIGGREQTSGSQSFSR